MKKLMGMFLVVLVSPLFAQAGKGRVTYSFTRQMTQKLSRNASREEIAEHFKNHIGQVYNLNWYYQNKAAGGHITVAEKTLVTFGLNKYWIRVIGKVPVTRESNWLNLKKKLVVARKSRNLKFKGGQKLRIRGIVDSIRISSGVAHHRHWYRNNTRGQYFTINVTLKNAVSPDL